MISAPVVAVTTHTITAIDQRIGSSLLVVRASLYAAMAMIAITAGPTPKKMLCTWESPW